MFSRKLVLFQHRSWVEWGIFPHITPKRPWIIQVGDTLTNHMNHGNPGCFVQLPHQGFQVPKMEESLTFIRLFLGMGIPLHKPYPYSLYR